MSSGSASVLASSSSRRSALSLSTVGVRLLSGTAYVISALLALAILSPIGVSFWGAMTTSKAMGTASEVGPGWQTPAAPAKAGDIYEERAQVQTGYFTSLWYRYVLRVYGKTILFSLQLAVLSVVLTT